MENFTQNKNLKKLHHLCKWCQRCELEYKRWLCEKGFTISVKCKWCQICELKKQASILKMILQKKVHHLCKWCQRCDFENYISISRHDSVKCARDASVKTTFQSPEMTLWKRFHHLCKWCQRCELENNVSFSIDYSVKKSAPSMKMMPDLRLWTPCFHLQRWGDKAPPSL